jgi:alpha-tubulin suppressor-like RCC1 family protein
MTNVPSLISALSNLSQYVESKKSVLPIRVASVTLGTHHAFAVLDDGRSDEVGDFGRDVIAWGLNDRGQLGRIDGKKSNAATPIWVTPIEYGSSAASSTQSEGEVAIASAAEANEKDAKLGKKEVLEAVPWENANTALGRLQIAGPGWVYGVKGWWKQSRVKCEQGVAVGDGVSAIYTKVVP